MTSVPKLSPDVVPIQIVCRKVVLNDDKGHHEIKAFTHLWKNVLHVVESAKNCSPGTTKYQQNFCLLIQEVLRSNPHLFTADEKNFIGTNSITWCCYFFCLLNFLRPVLTMFQCYLLTESFTRLSDDGQRLFVRLYTRKGY